MGGDKGMRDRVEYLGVIKEKLSKILEYNDFLDRASSKHSIDSFIEFYGKEKNLEDLHDNIRYFKDELWNIFAVASGDTDDDTD